MTILAFSFIPLLIIALLIWFFLRANKHSKNRMNRKLTYVLLAAYTMILLISTLTVEIVDTKFAASQLKAGSYKEVQQLERAIQSGDIPSIDPSKIIDQRTHTVGEILSVTSSDYDYNPTIIIERKQENDGVIEETIVKPLLLIGDFDFSDQISYLLPIWEDNKVIFPPPPQMEITYTSYKNSSLLGQFTQQPKQVDFSPDTMSRQIAVHLLVPKDLTIVVDEHLYINYVSE